MRKALLSLSLVVAMFGACSDSVPSGLSDDVLGDVQVTARVEPVNQGVAVLVSLSNRGNQPMSLSYPAGCPVRLRLYRALDDGLVFDEADKPCTNQTPISVGIEPGATVTLTSGLRAVRDILGDSLLPGPYNVGAILRVVGQSPIEVSAGLFNVVLPEPSAGLRCSETGRQGTLRQKQYLLK